jgi:hypothetical protein
MIKVIRGTVTANNTDYSIGKTIPGLTDEQEARLVSKGIAEFVVTEKLKKANAEGETDKKPKVDPKEKDKGKDSTTKKGKGKGKATSETEGSEPEEETDPGTGTDEEGSEDDNNSDENGNDDEGNDNQDEKPDLNIGINPEDLIQGAQDGK